MQRNPMFFIPAAIIENDVLQGLFAGQYGREQYAVVVGVGLGTEHGDVVQRTVQLQELFDGTDAGHTVADDDEIHFFHDAMMVSGCSDRSSAWDAAASWPSGAGRLWRWCRKPRTAARQAA